MTHILLLKYFMNIMVIIVKSKRCVNLKSRQC